MSNTIKRKKAFQKFCRDQVKQGLINQADGSWARATQKWQDQHMIAGYNFEKRRRKGPSKSGAEVE